MVDTMTFVDVETGEIMGKVQTDKDPVQEVLDFLSDKNFKFTPTGVKIVGFPTFEQCETKVNQIQELKRLTPIYLGDLLNYMESRWGEGYAQVLDPTGYSYQHAANTKSIMGGVPPEVRQPGLTFTHYKIVKPFSQPDQRRLLAKAKAENLNTTTFNHLARLEKRKAKLGKLPRKVKMEMTAVFEVPADLKAKMRDLAEGWAGRLWEWDIECTGLSFEEDGQ